MADDGKRISLSLKDYLPLTCPSGIQTCVDKHLIFGQIGENYSKLVQKTEKYLDYSVFMLIFAP